MCMDINVALIGKFNRKSMFNRNKKINKHTNNSKYKPAHKYTNHAVKRYIDVY